MSYLIIEDFRGGLDARKSRLSAPAGTLTGLVNAHVSQGGELEKRKAFTLFADLEILDSNGDQGTFGVQEVAAGLVVFGSALPYGVAPTLNQPVLAADLPVTVPPVSYQQLQHPAILDGVNYDRTKHRMTAIVYSTVFGGVALAIAKYADGQVFGYDNGALMKDFTGGVVLEHQAGDNTKVAKAMAAEIDRWLPQYNGTWNNNATSDIESQPGTGYNLIPSVTSAAGTLTSAEVDAGVPSVAAAAAAGQFSILTGTASPGNNYIAAVKVHVTRAVKSATVARTGNVATVTTGTAHGFNTGTVVTVVAPSHTGFNCTNVTVASVPNATTFTYANTGADLVQTNDATATITGTTWTEILGSNVNWVTDNAHTAIAVATQINNYASVPEFVAVADGNTVRLYADTSSGATPNGWDVQVTVAGNVCIGDCSFTLGGNGFDVTAVYVNGSNILKDEVGTGVTYTVGWRTTVDQLCADLAAAINSRSLSYNAYSSGNFVRISSRATRSSDAVKTVTVALSSGGTVAGAGSTPLMVAATPSALALVNYGGKATTIGGAAGGLAGGAMMYDKEGILISRIQSTVAGGVPPYTYAWWVIADSGNQGLLPVLESGADGPAPIVAGQNYYDTTGHHYLGGVRLKVTDSVGTIAYSNQIPVSM